MVKKIWNEIKPHLPYFATITFGCLLLFLVFSVKGTVGFIIGVLAMSMIVGGLFSWGILLEKKMEEDGPYFFDDPIYEKRWEQILHVGSGVFMFFCFIGGAATQFWTDNVLKETQFFIFSIITGALVATAFLLILKKVFPFVFVKNDTRWKELMCIWVGFVCCVIILMAGIVFYPEPISSRIQKVAIVEHGADKDDPEAYIWIEYAQHARMKLRPNRDDYKMLKGKDSTVLIVSKSLLGFEYVCEMLPE